MDDRPSETFLNVPRLLEASAPAVRTSWFWYLAGTLLLIMMLSSYLTSRLAHAQQLIGAISTLSLLGVVLAMMAAAWMAARAVQREQSHLEAIEELIQLRHWEQAAGMLEALLSKPVRQPQSRLQGMLYLAAVLGRYHRFGDAITVYDILLRGIGSDVEGAFGIKLARAMSQLRDDRLFDVDRAISELRRAPGAGESAALALVEIYRDVKTGHPQEAAALFAEKRPVLRRQLGVRLADALALAARAQDMQGNEAEAKSLYEEATLLAPEVELARRYPEVAPLVGKYPPAMPPGEGA
jgi:tetratricopeptide (TPR) repeat protein